LLQIHLPQELVLHLLLVPLIDLPQELLVLMRYLNQMLDEKLRRLLGVRYR
jgi:hypothetical protein